MEWMILPLQRYADFQGRSRRMEYWMFTLFVAIVSFFLLFVLGAMLGGGLAASGGEIDSYADAGFMSLFGGTAGILALLFFLAILIPSIAVQVRRFHDQDKSGWFVLLGFVPFVGGLIILVFMLLEGTRGPNQYGPDPKG